MRNRRRAATLAVVTLVAALLGYFGPHASGRDVGEPEIICPQSDFILLDPGHGGIDGGANRNGLLEKEIVLDVALRMERILKERQIPVLLTRTEDVDLGGRNDNGRLRRDLSRRIRMANQCGAEFVLSIHANSAGNRAERGMIFFYQPSPWGRDSAFLLADILRQRSLHTRMERPHPRGDFVLLRLARAPAVLVELGFLTHPDDWIKLENPDYREQVAQALAEGCSLIWNQWVN